MYTYTYIHHYHEQDHPNLSLNLWWPLATVRYVWIFHFASTIVASLPSVFIHSSASCDVPCRFSQISTLFKHHNRSTKISERNSTWNLVQINYRPWECFPCCGLLWSSTKSVQNQQTFVLSSQIVMWCQFAVIPFLLIYPTARQPRIRGIFLLFLSFFFLFLIFLPQPCWKTDFLLLAWWQHERPHKKQDNSHGRWVVRRECSSPNSTICEKTK